MCVLFITTAATFNRYLHGFNQLHTQVLSFLPNSHYEALFNRRFRLWHNHHPIHLFQQHFFFHPLSVPPCCWLSAQTLRLLSESGYWLSNGQFPGIIQMKIRFPVYNLVSPEFSQMCKCTFWGKGNTNTPSIHFISWHDFMIFNIHIFWRRYPKCSGTVRTIYYLKNPTTLMWIKQEITNRSENCFK